MSENKSDKYSCSVGQLQEILKAFPADMPVLVSGYEGGYEHFYPPKIIKMKHVPGQPSWDGEFDKVQEEDRDGFDAVVVERVVRDE